MILKKNVTYDYLWRMCTYVVYRNYKTNTLNECSWTDCIWYELGFYWGGAVQNAIKLCSGSYVTVLDLENRLIGFINDF